MHKHAESTYQERLDPVLDQQRLGDLADLAVWEWESRHGLNAVAEEAARRLGFPTALVSLVLNSAQYHAGAYGVVDWAAEIEGLPVEWSFCAEVVRSAKPHLVEDARVDSRYANNPLVRHDLVTSYGGVPLRSAGGQILGALCVIGNTPHRFGADEVEKLTELASAAAAVLELGRRAAPTT